MMCCLPIPHKARNGSTVAFPPGESIDVLVFPLERVDESSTWKQLLQGTHQTLYRHGQSAMSALQEAVHVAKYHVTHH